MASWGEIINSLDFAPAQIADDAVVTEAIILAKVTHFESGEVTTYQAGSRSLTWMERLGMLTAAQKLALDGQQFIGDEQGDE